MIFAIKKNLSQPLIFFFKNNYEDRNRFNNLSEKNEMKNAFDINFSLQPDDRKVMADLLTKGKSRGIKVEVKSV